MPHTELVERSRRVRERRQKQQRHDVRDLDHRIDGRTGSVLVRIADRVASRHKDGGQVKP